MDAAKQSKAVEIMDELKTIAAEELKHRQDRISLQEQIQTHTNDIEQIQNRKRNLQDQLMNLIYEDKPKKE